VKLLLDECVTRHLKREFANHEVHTVEEAGFKGFENGHLLRAASGSYDVLITVDRNLPYQQNLTDLEISILILSAQRNSYVRLKPLMPQALKALESIKPREIILIDGW
jgi:predicted nuclease of predicted toxin-antitoxin system